MNRKLKNVSQPATNLEDSNNSDETGLADSKIPKKIKFVKQVLLIQLVWQAIIIISCLISYLKPLNFPDSINYVMKSDILIITLLFFTIYSLFKGSSKIHDKKNHFWNLASIILCQTCLYSAITFKLDDSTAINFLIIHIASFLVLVNLLLFIISQTEVDCLVYFKKMFQFSLILLGAEYFFTKHTSINTLPGVIILFSLLGFGTFTIKSLQAILLGKFNLKLEQVYLGAIVTYVNMLLPNRSDQ